MSGRSRRRVSEFLTGVASLTFPRARRADGRVVRDCAREAVDAAGLRALPRECLSLAIAGLGTRPREAALELRHAPWRAALSALPLPLAAATLVVWIFGFIPRYDHWPLGEGWAMLLGGSLLAVVGAALRHRWLTALGATATLAAAAAPYLGYGTDVAIAHTPSFFRGWSVDIGAASLLPALLLVAGALSLSPRPRPPVREVMGRLALGLMPAVVAIGPGTRPRHRAGSRERGVSAGLGGDSLGAGADALLGVQRRLPLLLAVVPLLLALVLMRRAGRA